MNIAFLRAGRTLALALLCLLPALAFAAALFTLVHSASKTLTTQKTIRLVAETGPENDMLSYRIDGLRNPILAVPKGAAVMVLFVTTPHGLKPDGF